MHSVLIDFLNHGSVPFAGRDPEIGRVVGFWQATNDADQLRAALLIGEAGIGKTRLIEETLPSIVQRGGAVVQIKLYPEAIASIAPLVLRALRSLSTRQQIVLNAFEPTLPSVIGALRRLAHLRPVLLVIEDLHLLTGAAVGELAQLLEALAGEPISLLCSARSIDLPSRAVLERYLVDEITLGGLPAQSLEDLWGELFAAPADRALVAQLQQATFGNPLAVRSALRGALKSGIIARDPLSGTWRCTLSGEAFARSLKRNVELLSEGMAAHLTDEEQRAAAALASLGEVFSSKAAGVVVEHADAMIEMLTFKGILHRVTTALPNLQGESIEDTPLAFTHSLLHRRLVDHGRCDPAPLVSIIASGLPLYSVLPFEIVAAYQGRVGLPAEEVERCINNTLRISHWLDRTADWKLTGRVWTAASTLVEYNLGDLPEDELRLLRARLFNFKIALLRREEHSPEYRFTAERLYELTAEPAAEGLRVYRIFALTYLDIHATRVGAAPSSSTWEQIEDLVEQYPALRFTEAYLFYLNHIGHASRRDREKDRKIENALMRILDSEDAGEEFRARARLRIYPTLLMAFDTVEELDERLRFLRDYPTLSGGQFSVQPQMMQIHFLVSIGRFDEALAMINENLPYVNERGLVRSSCSCELHRICIEATLRGEGNDLAAGIERLLETTPEDFQSQFRADALGYLFAYQTLLQKKEWGEDAIDLLIDDSFHVPLPVCILDDLSRGEMPPLDWETEDERLAAIARLAISPAFDAESFRQKARALLDEPPLRLSDHLKLRATVEIVLYAISREKVDAMELKEEIAHAIDRSLAWFAERRLNLFMEPMLKRYKEYLTRKEIASWRGVIEEMPKEGRGEGDRRGERKKTRLSMLGSICLQPPDGESAPVRGARLRALLGLMVADRMLEQPLAHREFSMIITGSDHVERARKGLNAVIFRLRELLGYKAILTDEETPRLNPDLFEVDLLQAHQLLREAGDALQRNLLHQARERLVAVIGITAGEVPFPTLYQTFFEALRDDFESEMRRLILRVSQGLMEEGDPQSAEALLEVGMKAIPADEEFSALRHQLLIELGKHVDAERVRMQAVLEGS